MSMLLFIILQLLFTVASNTQQVETASSIPLCLSNEREALLTFKNSFNYFLYSWKNSDCCLWEGVTCHHSSGHVTELHLSGLKIYGDCLTGSCITGSFPSNSTLFNLRHLRYLDLAENNFSGTPIPMDFGRLSNLEYLNLSLSGFTGQVPQEIGWLSQLTTLDFSYLLDVEMPNFKTIITNLTELRELDLLLVTISSDLPPTIANLSKLESLRLGSCHLQGEFQETTILSMPNLRVLDLDGNYDMYRRFSNLRWRSPLEFVDFSDNFNFVGVLPEIIGNSSNFSLRYFSIDGCYFSGDTPSWIWNVSEVISTNLNSLFGSIPSTVNATRLTRLSTISFDSNKITGTIPAWLFTLPSLKTVNFDHNLLTGIDESTNLSICSSKLLMFSIVNNQLQGRIPEAIFGLHNLQTLKLDQNNLTGTILFSKIFKLQNLDTLLLSHNNLFLVDDVGVESSTSFRRLKILGLSFCNLGHFPSFLRKQQMLLVLDLSNNGIHDVVPEWFKNLISLLVLDLSYNSLTISLENPQRQNTKHINMELSSATSCSLCHLSHLQLLDLSHNNLAGFIPDCFTNFISQDLQILDLKQNKLQGVIPSIIFESCSNQFNTLCLSGNLLQGPLPKSLRNCKQLQLLDVWDNKLSGTFPHWLYILPYLEVLVLGSNNLQGPLISSNKINMFQKMRIFDISNNNLTGSLPPSLFVSFKAMMDVVSSNFDDGYMNDYSLDVSYDSYQDRIKAWVKGFYRELPKIMYSLTLIDVSRNRLEGEIPKTIGDLVSIRGLNLAHNNFTGNIPRSFGNLSVLESLDLSFNKLDGQIPCELVNLNSLEFFNVSENNLVGSVPTGKQFNTFLDSCYLGNPRLCGEVLTKKCRKNDEPPTSTSAEESGSRSSSFHVWEIVSMGFGCGFLAGSVWGYFIVWKSNYYWVVKLIFKIELFMMRWSRRMGLQNRRP